MGGTPLQDFAHPPRAVYVLGSEDNGLNRPIVEACQCHVALPKWFGRSASYNVAMAGTLVMYDRMIKQLWAGGREGAERRRRRRRRRRCGARGPLIRGGGSGGGRGGVALQLACGSCSLRVVVLYSKYSISYVPSTVPCTLRSSISPRARPRPVVSASPLPLKSRARAVPSTPAVASSCSRGSNATRLSRSSSSPHRRRRPRRRPPVAVAVAVLGPFHTSERRGGVERRQLELKGVEGGD